MTSAETVGGKQHQVKIDKAGGTPDQFSRRRNLAGGFIECLEWRLGISTRGYSTVDSCVERGLGPEKREGLARSPQGCVLR